MNERLNKWQHNPRWNGKFSWVNTSFLIATPALTLMLMPWQIWAHGFSAWDFAIFFVMMCASGLSVTAGYHRLFSHQTYEASSLVKFFFLVFGAGAFQNSAFKWCSDHRYHHRFVDKEGDPYSINKGFFHAHMGWIFYTDPPERSFDNAKDLADDKLVAWQHRNYLWLSVLTGFVLPTFLGWLVDRPFAGFIWGGLFRVIFVHHGTFFINSLAHTFGTRPYSTKNSARDSWWLAFFTNGEGFHNFHHAFANDYRNGLRWYHWDPSKWLILSLNGLGLSHNLQRTPEAHILKAKMEASLDQFRHGWKQEMPQQLETMRQALDAKLHELQLKYKEFQAWKESCAKDSARWGKVRSRYWRKRLRAEAMALETAVNEYRELLHFTLNQGAVPALA
jgi:stearoyl-CoA desaturase (delta-9 desaturase)